MSPLFAKATKRPMYAMTPAIPAATSQATVSDKERFARRGSRRRAAR